MQSSKINSQPTKMDSSNVFISWGLESPGSALFVAVDAFWRKLLKDVKQNDFDDWLKSIKDRCVTKFRINPNNISLQELCSDEVCKFLNNFFFVLGMETNST